MRSRTLAIWCAGLWGTGGLAADAGRGPRAAKPVYLSPVQGSGPSTEMARFATTLLELRLASVKEVLVSQGDGDPKCTGALAQQMSAQAPSGRQDGRSQTPGKHFAVTAAVSAEGTLGGRSFLTYVLTQFDGCKASPLIRGSRKFDREAALATLNEIGDEIAWKLAEAASDKVRVKVVSKNEDLQSYMELTFGDSDLFRPVSSGPSVYTVVGSRSPAGGVPRFTFRLEGTSGQSTSYVPQKQGKPTPVSFVSIDAARHALEWLTDIEARRTVGVSDDPSKIELTVLLERARAAACLDRGCEPNPRAVVALLRDRADALPPGGYELLGDAWLQLDRAADAAGSYDKALAKEASKPADQRRALLSKAGNAWWQADEPDKALDRWRTLASMEREAGGITPETGLNLARAASARLQHREAWSSLLDVASRAGGTAVSEEWDRILSALDAPELAQACAEAGKRGVGAELRAACLSARGRSSIRTGDSAGGLEQYRQAIEILRKAQPPSQKRLSDVLYEYANRLDWSTQRPAARSAAAEALEIRRRVWGEDHSTTGDSLHQVGLLFSWDRNFPESQKYLEQALSIRSRTASPTAELGWTERALGYVFGQLRDYRRAEEMLGQAIAIFGQLGRSGDLVETHREYGSLLQRTDRFKDAEDEYRKALAASSASDQGSDATARTMGELAAVLANRGNFTEARTMAERGLEIRKGFSPASARLAQSHGQLGITLLYLGDYAAARDQFTLDLGIRARLPDESPENLATNEFNIGLATEYAGLYEESERHYREAIKYRRKGQSIDPVEIAYDQMRLSNALTEQAKYSEASENLARSLPLLQTSLTESQIRWTIALHHEANLLLATGKLEPALEKAQMALRLRQSATSEGLWRQSMYLLLVGRILLAQGRATDAEQPYLQVIEIWKKMQVPAHPDIAWAEIGLGQAALLQKRYREAELHCGQAIAAAAAAKLPAHPDIAGAHGCLATAYSEGRHDLTKALPSEAKAVKVLEDSFTRPHPALAAALEQDARLLELSGNTGQAANQRTRAAELRSAHAALEAKTGNTGGPF